MPIWTEVIDPATATGFARASEAEYEASKGSLARWLPNREVPDVSVRFVAGRAGLTEEAKYRAFDAEPEFGSRNPGRRVTIDLAALSQQGIVSERDQLRLRNAPQDMREKILVDSIRDAVRAVADRSERQRGQVLVTGSATIEQDNYSDTANFGRRADFTYAAAQQWTTPEADRMETLNVATERYTDENGEPPGAAVMSTRTYRALASGSQFRINLVSGGSRPSSRDDVNTILSADGMPPIYLYDRRTRRNGAQRRIIPDNGILFVPAPVDPNTGDSELGATWWGQTLAASEPDFALQPSEQPGVVAAAFTHDGIPPIRHTYVDAFTLPVLANANLSMWVTVLPAPTPEGG